MYDTIEVLEKLRTKLDDAQASRMANAHIEANKHYYTVGYGDGLQEAILMLDVAIKEEEEKERLRESARWGY